MYYQALLAKSGVIMHWMISIAISEAQITCWMFFIVAHCNIITVHQRETKEQKLSRKKNGHRKKFE